MEWWPPTSPAERDRCPSGRAANGPVQIHCEEESSEEKAKEKQEWKKASLHHCNVLVNTLSEIGLYKPRWNSQTQKP